jgi:hypothetical protein
VVRPIARSLQWNGARVELGWGWTTRALPFGGLLAPDDGIALLRAVRQDPAAMDTLREVLGDELSGSGIARLSDDEVIEQLAWRVENRWLRVAVTEVKLEPRVAGVEVVAQPAAAAASPPPPPPPPPPAARTSQTCTNPACAAAFQDAADNGTAMVERGGANCGTPEEAAATPTATPAATPAAAPATPAAPAATPAAGAAPAPAARSSAAGSVAPAAAAGPASPGTTSAAAPGTTPGTTPAPPAGGDEPAPRTCSNPACAAAFQDAAARGAPVVDRSPANCA